MEKVIYPRPGLHKTLNGDSLNGDSPLKGICSPEIDLLPVKDFGNHVAIKMPQNGHICPVVSGYLDSEGLAMHLEVLLESEKQYKQVRTHERSSALHKRLHKAEEEIQDLKAQIATQRASWEMRFTELQRKQHDLRDQLHSEIVVRASAFHKVPDSEELSEAYSETGLENGQHFEEKEHDCSSGLNQIRQLRGPDMRLLQDGVYSNSLICGQATFPTAVDSRSTSAMSASASVGSWRSGSGPHRVFVPHSPMDLHTGHRVRVLLPSGRISTGTLRYLGKLQGSADIQLGVELEMAENGQQTGTYEGQCYFDCKPGHGVFVAFSKLLMAWE